MLSAAHAGVNFKGKDISIQEIADKLGVGAVVEGSVRRAGERLRVTAQLIRAAAGSTCSRKSFEPFVKKLKTVNKLNVSCGSGSGKL